MGIIHETTTDCRFYVYTYVGRSRWVRVRGSIVFLEYECFSIMTVRRLWPSIRVRHHGNTRHHFCVWLDEYEFNTSKRVDMPTETRTDFWERWATIRMQKSLGGYVTSVFMVLLYTDSHIKSLDLW